MNEKRIQNHMEQLQLVFIKNSGHTHKKKQASKKYSSTSYTIAHPEPPKHTVLPACFSCKIFCWLMLASLSVNVHSFKTLYYKHEHKMAPKSVRLKLPVTLNPRKCSEVCVNTGMCAWQSCVCFVGPQVWALQHDSKLLRSRRIMPQSLILSLLSCLLSF